VSEPPINIRPSGTEDATVLLEIDQICFPPDIAFSRDEMASYLSHPKSIAWVAERAGRILGYAIVHMGGDRFAHIVTLDVLPEARRQKIGTALMNRMHRELRQRGVQGIVLEVGVDNRPARKLYEKLQYRYLERLPGYYHGREDAYRMARFFG
jgi:ribosomal protein S18 acetylase RimI-like enzyme